MINLLLDLFFPRRSLTGNEGEWITEDERKRMRLFPMRLKKEMLKKKGISHLDCLIAAGNYQSSPLLQKAIKTFKYNHIQDLGPELGQRIVESLSGLLRLPAKDNHTDHLPLATDRLIPILCPVPLHWSRHFQRGFNQAEILAKIIAEKRGWPVHNLLKRTRATGHQAWRKRAERLTAVTGAFAYRGDSPAPDCVILVDDICTTGATLEACAKTLKKAGVKQIVGLVVAYG